MKSSPRGAGGGEGSLMTDDRGQAGMVLPWGTGDGQILHECMRKNRGNFFLVMIVVLRFF